MTNLAVIYQSERGHTKTLSEAVLTGARQVSGVSAEIFEISGRNVREGRFEDLELMKSLDETDGIIFGSATYMGSGSAIFKSFREAAFRPHWLEQRWKDKLAAGFTNSVSRSAKQRHLWRQRMPLKQRHALQVS